MNKQNSAKTTIVGFFSSILAFLGIVSCCGFPLIAAFLAWFGIGASQLSFFAEYRLVFTTIAIISILYGFYTVYIKPEKQASSSCCSINIEEDNTTTESCCKPSNKSSILSKIMLWVGAVVVAASIFMDSEASSTQAESSSCDEPVKQEASCCTGTTEAVEEKASCCPSTKAATKDSVESKKENSCCN